MSIAQGRDLRATTLAVSVGAAPEIAAGVEFETGSVQIDSLPARPASVCFELPMVLTIPAGESASYEGHLEKSANGSTWETIEGSECSGAWANPAGAAGDLELYTAIRIGGDLVQSGLAHVRAVGTLTLSDDEEVVVAQHGAVAVFGGLDRTPDESVSATVTPLA